MDNKVIVLDVDQIFTDVCLSEHNEQFENTGFLDLLKFSYKEIKKLENECGLHSPVVWDFFKSFNYLKTGIASDFFRMIEEVQIRFKEEEYSWVVISHTPKDLSDLTHRTKKEFIEDTLLKCGIINYDCFFTETSHDKCQILIENDKFPICIVEDNPKSIQGYLDAGFHSCSYYAPNRLIWKKALQEKFPNLIKFYC